MRKSILLAMTTLLAACAPQATPPQDIQSQIETSVAQTVEAQNQMGTFVAQTVEAQQPAATETLQALPTLTPVLPTATTFVVIPPSSGGGSGGSGGGGTSSKPQQYLCTLIAQNPNDGSSATILKVGDTLDVHWTLRNDGTKTWESTWPWDFYSSQVATSDPDNYGLTMSSVGFQSTLGADVAPGGTIKLGVELTAPDFSGNKPIHIGTAWTIKGDGSKFCIVDINTEIIKPGMTP